MSGWAYIFDFDGVLMNTMAEHFACYRDALAEFGIPIDRDQFYHQAGMTGREQIAYFASAAGVEVDPADVYRRKKEISAARPVNGEPIGINLDLLRVLRANGVPCAIASGSSRDSILPLLEKHQIAIDAVVTSEDVACGKPNPDLFLAAAAALDVAPERCLVVEDSEVGVQAAVAAGMKIFRFTDSSNG